MGIGSYQTLANQAALQYGVPPALLSWQLNQESSWNPYAVNGGAMGIAQLDQAQMNRFGGGSPYDPSQAIPVAAQIDAALYGKTGNWGTVLQQYGTTANVPQSVQDSANVMLAGLGSTPATGGGGVTDASTGGGDGSGQGACAAGDLHCQMNAMSYNLFGITSPFYSGPDLTNPQTNPAGASGSINAGTGAGAGAGAGGGSTATGAATKFFNTLSSGGTWQRIGMVILGVVILIFVLAGLTKGQGQ
jgi:hypothetical protein